jgi:hypothetical protein
MAAEELAYRLAGPGSVFGQHHGSGTAMGSAREGHTDVYPRLDFQTKLEIEIKTT